MFKESAAPDLVPAFLAASAHLASAQDPKDLSAAAKVLKGLAKTNGFGMTLMLLGEADKAHVRGACDLLSKSAKHAEDAAEIRATYSV